MSGYWQDEPTGADADGPMTDDEREAILSEFPEAHKAMQAFNNLPAPF